MLSTLIGSHGFVTYGGAKARIGCAVACENHTSLWIQPAFYNVISLETDKLPWDAADLLLRRADEKRRVARGTARRCLIDAHYEYLPKAVNQGKLSEHAIVNRALKKLAASERHDGNYVLPVKFAPFAKTSYLRFGPDARGEWQRYSERYDHFIELGLLYERHSAVLHQRQDICDEHPTASRCSHS